MKVTHTTERDFLQWIHLPLFSCVDCGRRQEWNISCGETGRTRKEYGLPLSFHVRQVHLRAVRPGVFEHDKGRVWRRCHRRRS